MINLYPHEAELITLLRLCLPDDKVEIFIKDSRNSGKVWVFKKTSEQRKVLTVLGAGEKEKKIYARP